MSYFDYATGLDVMTKQKLRRAVRRPVAHGPKPTSTSARWIIAASIQAVTEEIVLRIGPLDRPRDRHGPNLCMAGGVALNCVANGKILRDKAL